MPRLATARSAASDLQVALRHVRSDAAAGQHVRQARATSHTAHFLRFTACLRGRPEPTSFPKA